MSRGNDSAQYAQAQARKPLLRPVGAVELDVEEAMKGIAVDLGPLSRFSAGRPRRRREAAGVERPLNRSMVELTAKVEQRLVAAIWTLSRLPGGGASQGRCGLAYIQDAADRWANAVDPATGKDVGFGAMPVRPAPPTAAEITAMTEPLDWLTWLRRDNARIVYAAAASRRGDMGRRVSWERTRKFTGTAVTRQRLAVIYQEGLADIAGQLVLRAACELRASR